MHFLAFFYSERNTLGMAKCDGLDTGFLSIGALARIAGVAPETIRTWEQRYGFPVPDRLPSGHRRYDLDTAERIRLVRHALEAGIRPAEAVPASPTRLRRALVATAPAGGGEAEDWIERARAFDSQGLEQRFANALHAVGARSFIRSHALPFLRLLGERWGNGELGVAQEHFASERLTDFLASRWRPLVERAAGPLVVMATLPGEEHVLALHLGALLVAGEGFRVLFLGRECPLQEIAAVGRAQADAVLVGVSRTAKKGTTRRQLRELAESLGEVELLVGAPWKPLERAGVTWLRDFDELSSWTESVQQETR